MMEELKEKESYYCEACSLSMGLPVYHLSPLCGSRDDEDGEIAGLYDDGSARPGADA